MATIKTLKFKVLSEVKTVTDMQVKHTKRLQKLLDMPIHLLTRTRDGVNSKIAAENLYLSRPLKFFI